MNIIDKVEIDGLLGRTRPVKISFDEHYNFIIGQNGTGKTTLINLMAAVLLCDAEKLEKINFKKVVIKLRNLITAKAATITVTRTRKDSGPYAKISYQIKDSGKNVQFEVNELVDAAYSSHMILRGKNRHWGMNDYYGGIRQSIQELLHVRWLSIHRANSFSDRDEENRHQSSVDRKLHELHRNISIYFGRLSRSYSDQIVDFQQTSLLSMIRSESGFTLEKFSKEIDADKEKETLGSVFAALQVSRAKYQGMLDRHARDFKKAAEKFEKHAAVGIDELATIYNGWKAHVLVQEYGELEKKKTEIFRPRDIFLATVNALLAPRKQLAISSRNELVVKNVETQDEIELEDLSSGEKQLLIILGEALLQESAYVVYIADEPELSLHISWQEKLTESIKSLNANAQIVFATHSPDIVNTHGDKVINMEFIS